MLPKVPIALTLLVPFCKVTGQRNVLLLLVAVPCDTPFTKSCTEPQLEYAFAVMFAMRLLKVWPVIYTMAFVLQLAL